MPIETTTVYTKKRLMAYNDYIVSARTFFWGFVALFNLYIFGKLFYSVFNLTTNPYHLLSVGYILFMDAVLLFLYYGLPRFTVKKAKNLQAGLNYTFNEDDFTINIKTDEISETSSIKYKALYKVVKNGADLYLFTMRGRGSIVDISAFTKEQEQVLKGVIANHLDAKKIKWKI